MSDKIMSYSFILLAVIGGVLIFFFLVTAFVSFFLSFILETIEDIKEMRSILRGDK